MLGLHRVNASMWGMAPSFIGLCETARLGGMGACLASAGVAEDVGGRETLPVCPLLMVFLPACFLNTVKDDGQ